MSGFLSGISQDVRAVGGLASGLTSLAGLAGYGTPTTAEIGAWLAQLQPASWRGLGFGVNSSEYSRGRETAVHKYPFRDDVWVEDLGRAPRAVAFAAFVVGDDCYAQAKALLAAAETPGSGELIHPSLGSLTVSSVTKPRFSERKELGRVVEISFDFVETGISIYPSASISTTDASDNIADEADTASTSDFLDGFGDALGEGAAVVSAGVATASKWIGQVQRLAGDASLITGAVAGLSGTFGRYSNGARSTLLTGVNAAEGAIGAVVTARAAVGQAAAGVATLAAGL